MNPFPKLLIARNLSSSNPKCDEKWYVSTCLDWDKEERNLRYLHRDGSWKPYTCVKDKDGLMVWSGYFETKEEAEDCFKTAQQKNQTPVF